DEHQLMAKWLAVRGSLLAHYNIPAEDPKRWGMLAAYLAVDHIREMKDLKTKKWRDLSDASEVVHRIDEWRAKGLNIGVACERVITAARQGETALDKKIAKRKPGRLENLYYECKKLIRNPPPTIGARLLARYGIPAAQSWRW